MDGAGAEPGVAAAGRRVVGRGGAGRGAEHGVHPLGGDGAEHHPGPGVREDRLGQQPGVLQLFADDDRHVRGPAVPQRDLEQLPGVRQALADGEFGQRGGPVHHDPQRPADVLGGRTALPARRVDGHQPPLGLPRGPLQRRRAAGRRGLRGRHALPAGQEGVLAGAAAVHHDRVRVRQRLEQHRPQQGRDARRGRPEGQQVRLGGLAAGAPDDGRDVEGALPVGHRQGAPDAGRVREPEDGLARGRHEALGPDAGRQRGQGGDVEGALLLVPDEAVLAVPARPYPQQVLDPGAGVALAVREVRGVAQPQGDEPAVPVEAVVVEDLPPGAPVAVERRGIPRRREVGHQRLVQRLEAGGQRVLAARRPLRPLASAPGAGRQQGGRGERRPVGHEGDDDDAGGGQQQGGAALVARRALPAAPPGRGQRPQAPGDGDHRVQHVPGAVGDGTGQLPAAGERGPAGYGAAGRRAVGQGAGDPSSAHHGLLWTTFGTGGTPRG
ncbi:hypothetical protein AC230_24905 [Streptomyces caatingaensis]|uniref:Uncharacterized protein n=1 Tax=Streptomyces caatingaensis TaxID=1678637 RepID=A0A0K9XA39_9ACTN|nr:hypothetical protein AC230_24905 [Streptomyces caatingaensis]